MPTPTALGRRRPATRLTGRAVYADGPDIWPSAYVPAVGVSLLSRSVEGSRVTHLGTVYRKLVLGDAKVGRDDDGVAE